MPDNYRFGGGAGQTVLNPVVLVAMIVAVLLVLLLPRRYVIVPFFLIAFLAPPGQAVVVGGAHLYVLRIVLLIGCGRFFSAMLTAKSGFLLSGLNRIDKVFLLWAMCHATTFMLLYQEGGAAAYQFAFLLDSLGGYFVLRSLIHDDEDVRRAIKVLALVATIAGVCMVNEQVTRTNVFGLIGGPRITPEARADRLRCQGPFAHPILAGVFGGTVVPLFVWLWRSRRGRISAAVGLSGATAMVITSASSTPLMAYEVRVLTQEIVM